MVTGQRIRSQLPLYYEPPTSRICELGSNRRVVVGRSRYYTLIRGGEAEESILDIPLFFEINAPAREDTIEIWGSVCKHFRFPERQPLDTVIEKEIDVDNLVAAINATDEEVKQWLALLLDDYDIESTVENIEATSSLMRFWLEQQASKSGVKLEEDELSKLFRFAVRLAYEALYVGSV